MSGILRQYICAGASSPSQILALASSRGPVALAEAHAALIEAGRLHNTAMVVVPAEPPGKNLCNFIRGLVPRFSKVIVVASQASGRLAPGSFDRLIRASMPDAESKIKVMDSSGAMAEIVEQAEANGLYTKSHALQIFCDDQMARNFAQEIKDGGLRLDPTTMSVAPGGLPKDDADAIIKAVDSKDLAAMHRVLDPHVFSSDTGIPDYRMALLAKENLIRESTSPQRGFADMRAFDQIIQTFSDKLGHRGIQVTGEELGTGTMGRAYALANGKVLKITYDESEAKASSLIMQHPAEHLVRIFDVFKFPLGSIDLFGVVKERLAELSQEEKQDVMWAPEAVDIPKMKVELQRAGVEGFDDFNPGNVMKRGSTYVLVDPGYSDPRGGATPTLEVRGEALLRELQGMQAAPQAGAGSQMRSMGSSAWSGGRGVLKAPENHVPEDENASERDGALDQDIRGGGLDWGFGRRNGSSV